MLDRKIFAKIPVDEAGRIEVTAEILQQVYNPHSFNEMLKQLPEEAALFWEEGGRISKIFDDFKEGLKNSPLKDLCPTDVFYDIANGFENGSSGEAFNRIAEMTANPSVFQEEITKLEKKQTARKEAEQKERQEMDAKGAKNFAPTLSKFLGDIEWVERGDCLEATIPYDAGSKRAFLAMVDLLKQAGLSGQIANRQLFRNYSIVVCHSVHPARSSGGIA